MAQRRTEGTKITSALFWRDGESVTLTQNTMEAYLSFKGYLRNAMEKTESKEFTGMQLREEKAAALTIPAAERDCFWDNLRFFLILLVAWCHGVETARKYSEVLCMIHETVLSFIMPTFVYVTGYFAKGMATESDKRLKICNCLLLYTVSQLLHMAVRGADSFLKPAYGGWYLMGIMVWYLVLPLVSRFKPYAMIGLAVCAAALCGMDPAVTKALQLSRLICFFPLFLLGYYCTDDVGSMLKAKKMRAEQGVVFVVMVLLCVLWWTDKVPLGILHANKTYASMKLIPEEGIVLRLMWYAIATMMGFGFMALIPRKRLPVISILGTRTLPIFIWHTHLYSLIGTKTELFDKIGGRFGVWSAPIYFAAALIISLLFGNKWAAKPLDVFMKCRFTPFLIKKTG